MKQTLGALARECNAYDSGKTILKMSMKYGVLANCRNGITQMICKRTDITFVFLHMLDIPLQGGRHSDNACNIFRASANTQLLHSALLNRSNPRSLFHIKESDTLWSVEFMGGSRKQIDAKRFHIDGDMTNGLHGIGMKECMTQMNNSRKIGNSLNSSNFIIGQLDGDKSSFFVK